MPLARQCPGAEGREKQRKKSTIGSKPTAINDQLANAL
ncbi:hypothetical protein EPIR_1162 [Erwinia piriflorinigrans CFBP 5888]|uniref:Uncharacterized protein n=1 Tax=Erwinia piriflorinigrans CFBP 5888 TaxID=1161919 RepID=V5Z6J7_9GAMM|nr:hypothetical protein EPIR_1162 [Erwinia piriflorinigrans CFBP 5888]